LHTALDVEMSLGSDTEEEAKAGVAIEAKATNRQVGEHASFRVVP
jgi:hypothetical protein